MYTSNTRVPRAKFWDYVEHNYLEGIIPMQGNGGYSQRNASSVDTPCSIFFSWHHHPVVPQVYRLRRFCRKTEVRVGTSFQSVINATNTSGEFLGSVSAEAQHQLRNGAVCLETNAYRVPM